jgi:hypothetical protein
MIHRTRIDDVTPASGWRALPALGLEVSAPLWDVRPPLEGIDYARLTYRDALAVADRRDLTLLNFDALDAMREGATVIAPVTLPPTGDMRSAEWSRRHDREVARRVEGIDGPILGIGKHWIAGAPAGKCRIKGWWVDRLEAFTPPKGQKGHRSGPGWVQQGTGAPHDDLHHDYATTTILVRPMIRPALELGAMRAALELARSMFLGGETDAEAIVRVALSQVGVVEATGRNDGPQIKRYFEGCTRGGKPTGWASGWDWCAAFASWVLHVAGVTWIGRRIAVHELASDARAAGRLETSRAYRPRPGDLYIGARGGGDPLLGGTGHTRICIAEAGPMRYRGIGGNEDNRVLDATHSYDDPAWRAWIRST